MTFRPELKTVVLAGLIAVGGFAVQAAGEQQRPSFEQIDANGDGQITQAEMQEIGKARFARMDADGDGFLNLSEMMAQRGQRNERHAARMLERFDTDKNGSLDRSELSKAAEARGTRHGKGMMARMDMDEDGKLSLEEMMSHRGSDRMFDRLDANDDGTLSAEEFGKIGERMKKRHGKHGSE